MRIARRKQQQANSFDLLEEQLAHKTSKAARLPKATIPVTLPALPARQLPRRSRRTVPAQYQDTEDYRATFLPENPLAQMVAQDMSGLRLPKIVPEQRPSLVAQQRGSTMDSLLMIQHQPSVGIGWRPSVHATGGLHDRFA
jgi:hypothetical protein